MTEAATTLASGRSGSGCWTQWALPIVFAALLGGWSCLDRESDDRLAAADDLPGDFAPFDHDHAAWTRVLEQYAPSGSVDYAGLKRTAPADFSDYLRSLASVRRAEYAAWTRDQQLAFWINAYNAWTVQLILDHYPLKSIRSIGLLPGAAFRKDFIPLERLQGDTLSLGDIEHDILRGQFEAPRIHFAIVCASKSCPVLRKEAYRAADLDAQLQDAARTFIRDTSRNRFDADTRTLWLSSIFDWFGADFVRDGMTLQEVYASHVGAEAAAAVRAGPVQVEFLDYDWSLNGR